MFSEREIEMAIDWLREDWPRFDEAGRPVE